jgi:hypothetical protein
MACTITSLFLFAMLSIVAAGLAFRPGSNANPPARREEAPAAPSGRSAIA